MPKESQTTEEFHLPLVCLPPIQTEFGIADALSACLSLLVSSCKPHHQFPPTVGPDSLAPNFSCEFLIGPLRPHSTPQPSCSFSSLRLDCHHTHSPSCCVCQGNTTPTWFCIRIIEDLCTRLSASASFTCTFGRTHFFFRSCGLLLLGEDNMQHMTLFFRRSFGVSFVQPFLLGYTKIHQASAYAKIQLSSSFFLRGGGGGGRKFRNALCGSLYC
jgi:hypothetical protein